MLWFTLGLQFTDNALDLIHAGRKARQYEKLFFLTQQALKSFMFLTKFVKKMNRILFSSSFLYSYLITLVYGKKKPVDTFNVCRTVSLTKSTNS